MAKSGILQNLPHRRSAAALGQHGVVDHNRTIFIALIGNVIIAIAKLVAGLITGSAAMLAEAAHSFADCINEIFLGFSLVKSKRPADADHPFGYGRARFLWAFIAAIASFIVGGCVSIGLALRQIEMREPWHAKTAAWIVLGIAFVADGISFLQGLDQAKSQAGIRKMSVLQYLFRTSDPIIRAIIVEDSAALLGTVLAAAGLFFSRLAGTNLPDSIASLLIGALLAVTAIGLARPLADFLVGRSLPEQFMKQIQEILIASPAVEELMGLQAVYIGPEEAVVAAKIRPSKTNVDELAREMDELDHKIRDTVPFVADVFIDVTSNTGRNEMGAQPPREIPPLDSGGGP